MKPGARFTRSIPIVAAMLLSFAAAFFTATHVIAPAYAAQGNVSANAASSPSSGPVGTIITVGGSGWIMPDGTQVSFGYMVASNCVIVPDSQAGSLSGGFFSGWFRWPQQGTSLSTYTVCANVGGTTATANTFTVLSESAPQISIAPATLTAGQQATITGSNFFPAGTVVQPFWETAKGNIVFSITPAPSNNNGSISRTFTVPATTLPNGSYMIEAVVGGSQPPTLSASVPFTYNSPTPTPSPVPSRTPTPILSPTAAATKGSTPTASSTTPVATQNPTTGQTPVLNTTSNDPSSAGGNTLTRDQPDSVFLIAGVIGSLVLLITLLAIVLLIRHKKARSRKMIRRATPAAGPSTNGVSPWQNGLSASPPLGNGIPLPVSNGQFSPAPAWAGPPVNGGHAYTVGRAASMNDGTQYEGDKAAPLSSKPLPFTPYTQLLQHSAGGSTDASKPVLAPYDPTLEAMKRQAQIGLFAVPGQHRNGGPPSR